MHKGMVVTSETPKVSDDELYNLLRNEEIVEFNTRRPKGERYDLSGLDFRGLDLRGMYPFVSNWTISNLPPRPSSCAEKPAQFIA